MTEPLRGLFLSFEGTDGSGKSTQLRLLAARLRRGGYECVENLEPGGTEIGRQIRRLLLDPANHDMAPMAELLLMFASRAQAALERIRPALEHGAIVLSDRFTDSSLAYQGEARQLGFETVRALDSLALGGLAPELTICLQVDLEASLARAHRRNRKLPEGVPDETRLDAQPLDFHRRVQAGYHRIAAMEPERFRLVDANDRPEQIAERIWGLVRPLLDRAGSRLRRTPRSTSAPQDEN
jgi:dTMP kinase